MFLAGLVVLAAATSTPGAVSLWGSLHPGPHEVGYRVLGARDEARRSPPFEKGRPLQASVWYPARGARTAPLSYGDYVRVTASEKTLDPVTAGQGEEAEVLYRGFLASNGLGETGIAAWLGATMLAHRNAEPEGGRFPLVLLAQGNGGAAPDQALLAEYLASHGFVVATTPSPVRLGDEMASEADILRVAEAQALDLAFVLGRAEAWPDVDAGRFGLVGYSFGGRSAFLLLERARAGAFVSLDSGIGMRAGKGWLPPTRLDPGAVRAPILHIFETVEEAMIPDHDLLKACRGSDRLLVHVAGMGHLDFLTFGMAKAVVPGLSSSPADSLLAARIAAVFDYARSFLAFRIKGDGSAQEWLAAPEVPPGVFEVERLPPDAPAGQAAARSR